MKIIAVDDEKIALQGFAFLYSKRCPQCRDFWIPICIGGYITYGK